MNKLALHWQILIAILLAFVAGSWSGMESRLFDILYIDVYHFLGELFLNALKMLIVPLVMASIISGMSSVGQDANLGRIGGKTLAYFLVTTLAATLVGLVLVNLFTPGLIEGDAAENGLNLMRNEAATAELMARIGEHGAGDIVDVFLRMIPTNIVAAAAQGEMLGLIFFSLLYGFFMTRVSSRLAQVQITFWQSAFETMMAITLWVMRFAPLGVFGLVAKTVAATGFAAFVPLLWFFITVVLGLAIHTFITLPLILRFVGGVNPLWHFQAMLPALLTAFSTASSSATLPLTIECIEKNAGVSNRTSSFVLPLGATVNMDGTALYECVAAMFIAQAYGLEMSLVDQFLLIILALVTSIGVAGIPAASLVAITIILAAVGLPLEGLGLLLVTDRVLDMMRTAANVFGDTCGAVVIARSEGETGVLMVPPSQKPGSINYKNS